MQKRVPLPGAGQQVYASFISFVSMHDVGSSINHVIIKYTTMLLSNILNLACMLSNSTRDWLIGSSCLCDVQIKANDMPNGKLWNNFAQVTYTFYVHYCAAEGLQETSVMARQVLLYLFYGTWSSPDHKGRQPIIRYLHKKIISGRHRFGQFVKKYFADFLTKYKNLENPQSWSKFFMDNGKGEDAPIEFLVEIEKGLRKFGEDVHAMGTGTCINCTSYYQCMICHQF